MWNDKMVPRDREYTTHYDPIRQAEILVDETGYVPACGCKVPEVTTPEQAADYCKKAMIMSRAMEMQYRRQFGARVIGPSTEMQRSYGVAGGSQFTGGLIQSQLATVPDNALAGTSYTFSFDQEAQSRLSGTYMLEIMFLAGRGTANGGQLQQQLSAGTLTLNINGITVAPIRKAPLIATNQQANGTNRFIDLRAQNVLLPPFPFISITLDLVQNLAGGVGETSTIQAVVLAGHPDDGPGIGIQYVNR